MNQRAVAAFLALPLVAALAIVALLKPLPYTTYAPGPTIDVLGAPDGKEIIQVGDDQKTYRDNGQLRMVTVSVTPEDAKLNIFEVMAAWLDRSDAVYPKDAVYPDNQTADEARNEGQVQMVSSQDTAVAVAEQALGKTVTPSLEVTLVTPGSPADGALAVRDLIRAVNGTPLSDDIGKASDQLRSAIKSTPPGQEVTLTVLRDGKQVDVPVTPAPPSSDLFGTVTVTGTPTVGIFLGEGFILPFPVTVSIDSRIGGPSAGLMFSLAIYDTLTPGSLTGGGRVAGTGEIAPDGTVGAIGGIQQKIVGAREDGAQLFLVPADNCVDTKGAHNGDMRLVKVDTFDSALSSIEAWAKDHDAKLPELFMSQPSEEFSAEVPDLGLDTDPALAAAVLEIESHSAEVGWDQPGRLYALVGTAELVRREPALAAAMGLDDASADGSLTPVEQEQLPADRFEAALASIAWGPEVSGCAAVVERLVLPPDADDAIPDDPAEAATYALEHPGRQEVRMVVGVTRAGATYCALRLRAHDDDQSVVGGTDLVPELIALLGATLEPMEDDQHE